MLRIAALLLTLAACTTTITERGPKDAGGPATDSGTPVEVAGGDVGSDPTACSTAADGAACDDDNACTVDDVCADGVCVGGASAVCDDDSGCRTGACEPATGCVYTDLVDGEACSVGCFGAAVCSAGECVPDEATATLCPAPESSCIEAMQCDPATGECSVPILTPAGVSCDTDADICTLEACDGEGACSDTGELETCAAQQKNNPCWTWSCNKKTGCTQTLFVDGGSCNDNNPCTSNDTCQVTEVGQKACLGAPLWVDDNNPCTDDVCVDGEVLHTPVNGAVCEPGDGCTGGGLCVDGQCKANGPCVCNSDAECDDGNPCTADSCDEQCAYTNVDGGPCPGDGICEDGECVPPSIECDAADPTAPPAVLPAQGYDLGALSASFDYAASPAVVKLFDVPSPIKNIDAVYRHTNGEFSVVPNDGSEAAYRLSATGALLYESESLNGGEISMAEAADGQALGMAPAQKLVKVLKSGALVQFGSPTMKASALVQLPNGDVGVAGIGPEGVGVYQLAADDGAFVQKLTEDYPGSLNIGVGPGGKFWTAVTTSSVFRAELCGAFAAVADFEGTVEGLVALPNGDALVSNLSGSALHRHDAGTGQLTETIALGDSPRGMQLHPNGRVYVAGYKSVYELTFPCFGGGAPPCVADPEPEMDLPLQAEGFDVADDGSMTVAEVKKGEIAAACFGPGGVVTKAPFAVAQMGPQDKEGWNSVYVSRADKTHESVLAVHLESGPASGTGQDPSTWRLFWLDSACNVAGGPVDVQDLGIKTTLGTSEYFDIVMGDTGQTAAVYVAKDTEEGQIHNKLVIFDKTGKQVGSKVPFGQSECQDWGIRVAMRETTGELGVSCQNHASGPVLFQRFSATGEAVDPNMVIVVPSDKSNSSWYDSHTLGMNDAGGFVVVWERSNDNSLRAAFYGADGALLSDQNVGGVTQQFDGYRRRHARVQSLSDGSFVIPEAHSGTMPCATWWSASGAALPTAPQQENCVLMRVDAGKNVYSLPKKGTLLMADPL